MHFKNGRLAKQGDHVITKGYSGNVVTGVVFDLTGLENTCNCTVAVPIPGGVQTLTCQNLSTMYHAEDGFAALEAQFQPQPSITANPTT